MSLTVASSVSRRPVLALSGPIGEAGVSAMLREMHWPSTTIEIRNSKASLLQLIDFTLCKFPGILVIQRIHGAYTVVNQFLLQVCSIA